MNEQKPIKSQEESCREYEEALQIFFRMFSCNKTIFYEKKQGTYGEGTELCIRRTKCRDSMGRDTPYEIHSEDEFYHRGHETDHKKEDFILFKKVGKKWIKLLSMHGNYYISPSVFEIYVNPEFWQLVEGSLEEKARID